jgi:hypothetical protein
VSCAAAKLQSVAQANVPLRPALSNVAPGTGKAVVSSLLIDLLSEPAGSELDSENEADGPSLAHASTLKLPLIVVSINEKAAGFTCSSMLMAKPPPQLVHVAQEGPLYAPKPTNEQRSCAVVLPTSKASRMRLVVFIAGRWSSPSLFAN